MLVTLACSPVILWTLENSLIYKSRVMCEISCAHIRASAIIRMALLRVALDIVTLSKNVQEKFWN